MTVIHAIDAHGGGMHARVVMGGIGELNPPGSTMREKYDYFSSHDAWFRRLMLREPRGFPMAFLNLVVPSTDPESRLGYMTFGSAAADPSPPVEGPLFLPDFRIVSGSNTIATATVLLESGAIPIREQLMRFCLDSPVGPIRIAADCESGKAKKVTVEMGPVYPTLISVPLSVPGLNTIIVDCVGPYLFTGAKALNLELDAGRGKDLVRVGHAIKEAALRQLDVPKCLSATIFTGPPKQSQNHGRQVGVFPSGSFALDRAASWASFLDRSPTGSALACRMAALYAKGELSIGDEFRAEGVLDTVFTGQILRETTAAGQRAIICSVSGRAWITGYCDYVVAHDDPFPSGFTIGDLWPS